MVHSCAQTASSIGAEASLVLKQQPCSTTETAATNSCLKKSKGATKMGKPTNIPQSEVLYGDGTPTPTSSPEFKFSENNGLTVKNQLDAGGFESIVAANFTADRGVAAGDGDEVIAIKARAVAAGGGFVDTISAGKFTAAGSGRNNYVTTLQLGVDAISPAKQVGCLYVFAGDVRGAKQVTLIQVEDVQGVALQTGQGWVVLGGRIKLPNLPTSSEGLEVGELWNDNGTLKIV